MSLCVIRQLVYCHCKSASSQASGEKATSKASRRLPAVPDTPSLPSTTTSPTSQDHGMYVCTYIRTNSTAVLPLPPGVSLERPVHPSNKRQLYEQSTTSTTTSSRSSKSSSMHLRRPCHACLTVQTCHNHPPARSQHADGAIGMIVSSRAQRSSASALAENGIPFASPKKKALPPRLGKPRLPAASH